MIDVGAFAILLTGTSNFRCILGIFGIIELYKRDTTELSDFLPFSLGLRHMISFYDCRNALEHGIR